MIVISLSELATSGVCCMRKMGEARAENECQWLSDGRPIDPKLFDMFENRDKQCNVVLVKFSNGKFTHSRKQYTKIPNPLIHQI